jgi:FecR protein
MSKLRFLAAALAFVVQAAIAQAPTLAAAGPFQPARVAGQVVLVEGDALHFDRAGALRSLRAGDQIFEGDRLLTGTDGELHLAMGDGGYIAVRPATELRIDLFRAEGRSGDRSEISLIKGSLRTVTGWIGSAGGALIRTFDATIGVRGTDHEPLVVPVGSARGEPGTYDRVHAGATYMETPQGTVDVRAGEAGFVPRGQGLPPEVLRVVPTLYQPSRNDGTFAGLNDRIKSQVAKLREARRSGDQRGDRPANVERAERPDRVERPERVERAERPERPEKPDRPGHNK